MTDTLKREHEVARTQLSRLADLRDVAWLQVHTKYATSKALEDYHTLDYAVKALETAAVQPLPVEGRGPYCHDEAIAGVLDRYPNDNTSVLLSADLKQRQSVGIQRYGRALQPHNGRDFLRDLYEELLDALAYGQGALYESDAPSHVKDVMQVHYEYLERYALYIRRLMHDRDGA